MAIYTKKGDRGSTSVLSGSMNKGNVSKNSQIIATIGALDEANSYLGICRANISDSDFQRIILSFQKDIFTIASILAGAKLTFMSEKIKVLESLIDKLEGDLPVLKNFIIPGGSKDSSHLMYARTLIRRAEREAVKLSEKANISSEIITYLNRLSDAVFMLGRLIDHVNSSDETVWKARVK